MNHYTYSVSDPADPRFQANAVIDDDELVLDIRTELESGEHSAVLGEPDQLRKIMAHFVPRYKCIRVSWRFGDNLTSFNRAIAAGATPEEAALRTSIGHQVALAGYSRVAVRDLEGSPAHYTKTVVSFRKP